MRRAPWIKQSRFIPLHLFPLLRERAPDQSDLVNMAIEEHEQVIPLMSAADVAVAAWEATGDSAGPELADRLRCLGEVLAAHLDHEEATIVPLAVEHVTAEEWRMVPAYARANFKGDKFWLIVGLSAEHRAPEDWAEILDNAPPEFRRWWETEGEPSFNSLIAEVRQAG